MQFKNLFFLASIASMTYGATVADVLTDIANILARSTAFDNGITAFSDTGGTLDQAMDIHNDAVSLRGATDATTTDVQTLPIPISVEDDTSILNAITNLGPTVLHGLNEVISKKPAFDTLGATDLVRQDLISLQAGTTGLGDALITHTPDSMLDQTLALREVFDDAFITAVAAYN